MLENLIRFSFPYPVAATYQNIESIIYPEEIPHKFNRMVDLYDSILKVLTYYLISYSTKEGYLDRGLQKQLETTLKNPTPSNWTGLLNSTLKNLKNSRDPLVQNINNFYNGSSTNLPKIRDAIYFMMDDMTPAVDVREVSVSKFFESYNRFISELDMTGFDYVGAINILFPAFQETLMKLEFLKDYAMAYVSAIQIDGPYYDHNVHLMQGLATQKKRYISENFLPERNRKMYLFKLLPDDMEPMFCLHPFVVVRKCSIHNKEEIYFLRYRSGEEMDYYCFQCRERFAPDRLLMDYEDTMQASVVAGGREVSDDLIGMYRDLLQIAWKDGILTSQERTNLEFLRKHFNLSKNLTRNMEEMVKQDLGVSGTELDIANIHEYEELIQHSIIKDIIISPLRTFIEQFRESLGIPREYSRKIESRIWFEEGLKQLKNSNTESAGKCFINAQALDETNMAAVEKLNEIFGESSHPQIRKTVTLSRKTALDESELMPGTMHPYEGLKPTVQMIDDEEQETMVLKINDDRIEETVTVSSEPAVRVTGPVIKVTELSDEPAEKPRRSTKRSKLIKAKKSSPIQMRSVRTTQPEEEEYEDLQQDAYPAEQEAPEDYDDNIVSEDDHVATENKSIIEEETEYDETYIKAVSDSNDIEGEPFGEVLLDDNDMEMDDKTGSGQSATESVISDVSDIADAVSGEKDNEISEPIGEIYIDKDSEIDADQNISSEADEETSIDLLPAEEESSEPEPDPDELPAMIEDLPMMDDISKLPVTDEPDMESMVEIDKNSIATVLEVEPPELLSMPAVEIEEDILPEPSAVERENEKESGVTSEKNDEELLYVPSIEIDDIEGKTESPHEKPKVSELLEEEPLQPLFQIEYEPEQEAEPEAESDDKEQDMLEFPSIEEVIDVSQKEEDNDISLWKEAKIDEEVSSLEIKVKQDTVETMSGEIIESEESEKHDEDPVEAVSEEEEPPKIIEISQEEQKRLDEQVALKIAEAENQLRSKEFGEAERILKEALELDGENPKAKLLLSKCLLADSRDEEAFVYLSQIYSKYIDSFEYLILHAKTARYLGKLEICADDLTKAIKLQPDTVNLYLVRGTVYFELGNFKKAIPDFNRVIDNRPEDVEAHIRRGQCLIELNKYDKALDNFKTASKIDPQNGEAIFQRGLVYYKLNNYEHAIRLFKRALEKDADNEYFLFQKAKANYHLGKFDDAMTDLERIIGKSPDFSDALELRGLIFEQKNQMKDALDNYQQLIQIKGNEANAYINLGRVYLEMDDFKNALANFDKALAMQPDNKKALIHKANTLLATEDYEEAVRIFTSIIEKSPRTGEAYLYRGIAYEKQKMVDKAKEDFQMYLQMNRIKG